ncbi:hypothetical protein DFA_01178 [Cavenderia fasciculata]|uniref:Transmembrane protein n=1 Tax=Cavenderia fasciculata TaxID=261658 RepID=F4PR97_CACFS|nr:uncharacterized protein DFA_01178 [Cavenderia fasciculata]EGG21297.1 hypothetical protein DFA_01178 [Cavenderia fasciculata]|eukprot:XP_004359147.1 hypothetical protein DFA_01178 [Cavenderia fasciculata]
MKGLLLTLLLVLTIILGVSSSVVHQKGEQFHQKVKQQFESGILPAGSPIYDYTCTVNPEYQSCTVVPTHEQNTTFCPTVPACLQYADLLGSKSLNIKVQAGRYSDCVGYMQGNFKLINIEPYSSIDIVKFTCNSTFLQYTSNSVAKMTITINNLNILSTASVGPAMGCFAVSSPYGSLLQITNTYIGGCRSNLNGGAINAQGFYVVLNSSTISDSYSNQNGGAVYSDDQIIALNSYFQGCSAKIAGGAFYTEQLAMYACTVNQCNASRSGVMQSNITVITGYTVLSENSALVTGGVSDIQKGSYFSANSTQFFSNFARNVGVLNIKTAQTKFQAYNCFFLSNNGTGAGTIRVELNSNDEPFNLDLTKSVFEYNNAQSIIGGDDVDFNAAFLSGSSIIGGYFMSKKSFTPQYDSNLNWVNVRVSSDCPASKPVKNILYTSEYQCGQVYGSCSGYAKVNYYGNVYDCTSDSSSSTDSSSNSWYSSSSWGEWSSSSFESWSSSSSSSDEEHGSILAAYLFTMVVALLSLCIFFTVVIPGFR